MKGHFELLERVVLAQQLHPVPVNTRGGKSVPVILHPICKDLLIATQTQKLVRDILSLGSLSSKSLIESF